MKRLAPLLVALFPAFASAQTVPPPFTVNGAVPTIGQWSAAWASKQDVSGALAVGGASGSVQYNNAGALGGFVVGGDGTLNTGTGTLTVTKTGGTAFSALATTAPGTGVAAALGVNTGSAGGLVLFNGALGTPTSATLTNATGYQAGNLAGLGTGVSTALAAATNSSAGLIEVAPTTAGDLAYWSGTAWTRLAGNTGGTKVLQQTAAGVPSWAVPAATGVTTVATTCPASSTSTSTVTLNNSLQVLSKTATYDSGSTPAPSAADCGAVIMFNITTASNYALPSPVTMGSGYGVTVKNRRASTQNLTVTPAAGQIDSVAALTLPPGSTVSIWSDGTNYFTSNGVGKQTTVFTASGTYTPNPSLDHVAIGCIGGGGGGGAGGALTSATQAVIYGGGPGGGGASRVMFYTAAELKSLYPTTVPITIVGGGAAGVGAAGTTGGNGAVGGNSTVGSGSNLLCNALGGGGGGGGGTVGAAGGAGAGMINNGPNAVANSATGPTGLSGGASGFGTAAGGTGVPAWCAGPGGLGPAVTTTAARIANASGLCTAPGTAGGGVPASGAAAAGGNGTVNFAVSASTAIYGGGSAGGGAGGTGQFTDGTLAINGLGLIGGGSGGSGGGCLGTGTGCTPQAAGLSGYGAGGSGGGACEDPTATCTGGAGGAGGAPIVQIIEYNTP